MVLMMVLICSLMLFIYTKSNRIDHIMLPAKLLFFVFVLNSFTFVALLIPFFFSKDYKIWMYN
jgi:hypothetical protein